MVMLDVVWRGESVLLHPVYILVYIYMYYQDRIILSSSAQLFNQ